MESAQETGRLSTRSMCWNWDKENASILQEKWNPFWISRGRQGSTVDCWLRKGTRNWTVPRTASPKWVGRALFPVFKMREKWWFWASVWSLWKLQSRTRNIITLLGVALRTSVWCMWEMSNAHRRKKHYISIFVKELVQASKYFRRMPVLRPVIWGNIGGNDHKNRVWQQVKKWQSPWAKWFDQGLFDKEFNGRGKMLHLAESQYPDFIANESCGTKLMAQHHKDQEMRLKASLRDYLQKLCTRKFKVRCVEQWDKRNATKTSGT